MKRFFVSVLGVIFLVGTCACGAGKNPPTWQEQYDLGIRYLSDGNYEEAIIAFTAAIEIDSKRVPAYVGRGDAYSGMARTLVQEIEDATLSTEAAARYESALADYLAALDLDETAAEVYRTAAEIYVALGNTEAAIELLKQGIKATEDERLQTYLDELTSKEFSPVLSGSFRTFRRTQRARAGSKRRSRQLPASLGQRLGQSADPFFARIISTQKQRKSSKI